MLELELYHGDAVAGTRKEPHVGEQNILNTTTHLTADGDAMRRDAGHIFDIDPARRALSISLAGSGLPFLPS